MISTIAVPFYRGVEPRCLLLDSNVKSRTTSSLKAQKELDYVDSSILNF